MPARDITFTANYADKIKKVVLDGIKMPVGGTALSAKATAMSSGKDLPGINASPSIVWTDEDGNKVSNASFNTAYTATVTLTKDAAHEKISG